MGVMGLLALLLCLCLCFLCLFQVIDLLWRKSLNTIVCSV